MREPRLREARDFLAASLLSLADADTVKTAYEAEVMVSVLFGRMAEVGVSPDVASTVLLDTVDELARRDDGRSYPGLRALSVIGPGEVREYASAAAARLAGKAGTDGVFRPPWLEDLGQVSVGTCRVAADPFGESTVLSCDFSYPGSASPHMVWTIIDATWHGAATMLSIADDAPATARKLLAANARELGVKSREITPTEAGALLAPALDALDRYGPPPGRMPDLRTGEDPNSVALSSIAMARHRLAILLGPDVKAPPADDVKDRWTRSDSQALVNEFLASPHGRDFSDLVSRTLPLAIITAYLQCGRDPRLTGPETIHHLLCDILPVTTVGPERFGDLIPAVLRAWSSWLAERNGLDDRARKKLLSGLDKLTPRFRDLWNDPHTQPLRRYVWDVPDEVACDGERQQEVIDRRIFAVPQAGDRPSGISQDSKGRVTKGSDLDPDSPRDRSLITAMYANSRGVPQPRFASYCAVVEQLWSDSQPEVWAQARRLRDASLSRDEIMKRLVRSFEQDSRQESEQDFG